MSAQLFQINGVVQDYPWGIVGEESLAAQFATSAHGYELKRNQPYAELWMGTHVNGPAKLHDEPSKTLSKHLSENRDFLGAAQRFPVVAKEPTDAHVPFLFKILTARSALPLQIHPNKDLAAKLHREDPAQFKDVNHKPEIAVALKPFKGFAGFRPVQRIADSIKAIPEVLNLVKSECSGVYSAFSSDPSADTLRPLFGALLKLPSSATESTVSELVKRAKNGLDGVPDGEKIASVLVKTESDYGSDPAVIVSALCMNLIELQPGEGIYVGADGVHAWLEGQIIELMATSDNVLNVGFMDDDEKNSVDLVTKVVTCEPINGDEYKLSPKSCDKASSDRTTLYTTPFEEFSLLHTSPGKVIEELGPFAGPLIGINVGEDGEIEHLQPGSKAVDIKRGSTWFLAAGQKIRLSESVELWAAFYDE